MATALLEPWPGGGGRVRQACTATAPNMPIRCHFVDITLDWPGRVETGYAAAVSYGLDAAGRFCRGVFGLLLHGFEKVRFERVQVAIPRLMYPDPRIEKEVQRLPKRTHHFELPEYWLRHRPACEQALVHCCGSLDMAAAAADEEEKSALQPLRLPVPCDRAALWEAIVNAANAAAGPRFGRRSYSYGIPQGRFYNSAANAIFPPIMYPTGGIRPVGLRPWLHGEDVIKGAGVTPEVKVWY